VWGFAIWGAASNFWRMLSRKGSFCKSKACFIWNLSRLIWTRFSPLFFMNVSYDRIPKVNPKSLRRTAISPIRYTLRQRKGRLSLSVKITENFCREQTALRQHQKPICYALCQRKGPSPLSEMTDVNSNYESDSKKTKLITLL